MSTWADLPYYRTQVDIAKSMEELRKLELAL